MCSVPVKLIMSRADGVLVTCRQPKVMLGDTMSAQCHVMTTFHFSDDIAKHFNIEVFKRPRMSTGHRVSAMIVIRQQTRGLGNVFDGPTVCIDQLKSLLLTRTSCEFNQIKRNKKVYYRKSSLLLNIDMTTCSLNIPIFMRN